MNAFRDLSQTEGIIPAIEGSHAVAGAFKAAADLKAKGYDKAVMIVNISVLRRQGHGHRGQMVRIPDRRAGRGARCHRRAGRHRRLNR